MHSFFLHRYGTHGQFTMNKSWEKFFFVMTYLLQGPSFLNPKAYAILHLEHHAHSDTAGDPHSPLNFSHSKFGADILSALPRMMISTEKMFTEVRKGTHHVVVLYKDRKFIGWGEFEQFASSLTSVVLTGTLFLVFYTAFVPVWWCWFFLPLTMASGAIQGAIVNWFGHMWGYRNYNLKDNSRNTWILSTVMMGELYQNNHHQDQQNPNFAKKWYELDPAYILIFILNKIGVIQINKRQSIS
jgi:stearoyl-CoA desaturase (delta-9 desaturase)